MDVKHKDEVGVQVPKDPELVGIVQDLLASIHPDYQTSLVERLTMYKNHQALQVRLSGPGSTMCMAKGETHSTNRANIWFVHTGAYRVYSGCYSSKCGAKFKKIEGLSTASLSLLFSTLKCRVLK